MAASPDYKVYDRAGRYQAACKEPEAAAVVVAWYGHGATIRYGHSRIVWAEGDEAGQNGMALESLDHVAEVVYSRMKRKAGA